MKRLLILALLCSTIVKLYLAIATVGTLDVAGFQDHLVKINQLGVGAYRVRGAFNNPFNSPPPMIHVIRLLGFLSKSGLSFGFWLRLPSILGDVGIFFLVWHWLKQLNRDSFWVLLSLALCPTLIGVSGYHGNTDSLMMFLVLLSVFLIEKKCGWAGIIFGLALSVKAMPLIFVPAIFLSLRLRRGLVFFGLASATVFIASLPYVLQDPVGIAKTVFGYSSIYGVWGWTMVAKYTFPGPFVKLHGDFDVQGVHKIFGEGLMWLTEALAIAVPLLMRKRKLIYQMGIVVGVVLFFAPGFGLQYLAWLVPFVPFGGVTISVVYYLVSGLQLLFSYIWLSNNWILPMASWLTVGVSTIVLIKAGLSSGRFDASAPPEKRSIELKGELEEFV